MTKDLFQDMDLTKTGPEMHALMTELYPICRSITGNGLRQTLKILQKRIPLEIHEVPSGTKVFDWTVPKEWNVRDAYVKNSKGEKIIDFKKLNLHLLNYSTPVNAKMPLSELKKHLFTLPKYPDLVPYLTSYYKEEWGFCLSYAQYQNLPEDTYSVVIDSSLEPGSLTYGELFLKGESQQEFLVSTYPCHPSMCDDNLSGVVLATFLAKHLSKFKLKYSYRFLFVPETIGSITWLSRNEHKLNNIKHGLLATCVGDSGAFTYKKTRLGNADVDKAVQKALSSSEIPYKILDFVPGGSDERQYCSPGFNLAVGCLMRTEPDTFREYHTSADDLNFVTPRALGESFEKYLETVSIIENNAVYFNLNPKCEPQLGKRGIYDLVGAKKEEFPQLAMLWVLNQSDGTNSLLDISIRSGMGFAEIRRAADLLSSVGLLKEM